MIDLEKEIIGFPFRKQLIGGVKKTDVTEYLENLLVLVENEREEIEKERIELYELMKNGQAFCSKLTAESQMTADTLIAEAQQKADELLNDANSKIQLLEGEYQELLLRSRTDAEKLAAAITLQQQESAVSYEMLLRPVKELLNTLDGEEDVF